MSIECLEGRCLLSGTAVTIAIDRDFLNGDSLSVQMNDSRDLLVVVTATGTQEQIEVYADGVLVGNPEISDDFEFVGVVGNNGGNKITLLLGGVVEQFSVTGGTGDDEITVDGGGGGGGFIHGNNGADIFTLIRVGDPTNDELPREVGQPHPDDQDDTIVTGDNGDDTLVVICSSSQDVVFIGGRGTDTSNGEIS